MFKKLKNNLKNNSQKGFSLVETLVAVAILLMAIAGPLTIASQALADARLAKNQTTARFLIQDAIEYVKNIRDQNNIAVDPWLTTIDACSGTCIVDSALDIVTVCGGNCPPLRYDETTSLYGYDANWDPTVFSRTVSINTVNNHEATVSVEISWTSGKISSEIIVEENIFNWHGED